MDGRKEDEESPPHRTQESPTRYFAKCRKEQEGGGIGRYRGELEGLLFSAKGIRGNRINKDKHRQVLPETGKREMWRVEMVLL